MTEFRLEIRKHLQSSRGEVLKQFPVGRETHFLLTVEKNISKFVNLIIPGNYIDSWGFLHLCSYSDSSKMWTPEGSETELSKARDMWETAHRNVPLSAHHHCTPAAAAQ